ncbi:flagellar assembly protein FliH [Microbulbifer sp.]|uniref:flagellar assembly protein FliH n=1 Tax=Microbulbifer sp. TaxID=1908541 RepID=UPI003F357FF9
MSDTWRRWSMGELSGGHDGGLAVDRRETELEALREETRERARLEGWEAGFQAGREEGLARGFEEGRRAGEEESARRRRELLEPLAGLAQGFSEALSRLDEEIAADLVDLALATGRQLAGDALREHPEQILDLVRALLREEPLLGDGPRLWLHPEDLSLAEAELGRELAAAGWKLCPDPRLRRGGCRVSGAAGELDASWENRWQELREQVRRPPPRPETAGEGSL